MYSHFCLANIKTFICLQVLKKSQIFTHTNIKEITKIELIKTHRPTQNEYKLLINKNKRAKYEIISLSPHYRKKKI